MSAGLLLCTLNHVAYAQPAGGGGAQPGGAQPSTPVLQIPRIENLCGISLYCFTDSAGKYTSGILLLPQANVGLIQIPLGTRSASAPSYRDAIGSFRPSVGVTVKFWFLKGFMDAHFQLLYGQAPPTAAGDNYLWGATLGLGGFSIINADIGILNRRVISNSDNVDVGGAFLINIDLTGAGVLLGTSVSGKK